MFALTHGRAKKGVNKKSWLYEAVVIADDDGRLRVLNWLAASANGEVSLSINGVSKAITRISRHQIKKLNARPERDE